MLQELYAIILDRKEKMPAGSYTARLFTEGEDRLVQKVGEEAIEVLIAAKGQGRERLVEEVADLLFHTLALLAYKDIPLAAVEEELRQRHLKKSGPPE